MSIHQYKTVKVGRWWATVVWLAALGCITSTALAANPPPADAQEAEATRQGIEFFEAKIRPLLAERCSECHGADVQEAGLRLDQTTGLRSGGDSGPVIVPGQPEQSLLIEAVQYQTALQMPPDGKLALEEIALLVEWVTRGAPLPAAEGSGAASPAAAADFDFAARLDHWCYRPLARAAAPDVNDPPWCASPVDRFVLAQLERAGLSPAVTAERRAWLRRVWYDVIGLPPGPDDLAQFAADESPEARHKVVDRLLASPQYGERWGRHWLDLVRYAETLGHEFDFDILYSWRYRDYVVQAFNADLPYDQFVREHLAGDLLPAPRRHPLTGANESIVATGFFWLGEGKHSPVDVRLEEAERIDNQLDVLGKAVLAQTLGCARCHDHKFDAISAQDYYALFGYVKSSRYQQAFLGGPSELYRGIEQLRSLRERIFAANRAAVAKRPLAAETLAKYLLAAAEGGEVAPTDEVARKNIERRAAADGLNPDRLAAWSKALRSEAAQQPSHPLYVWRRLALARDDANPWAQRRDQLVEELRAARAAIDAGAARVPALDRFALTGEAFSQAGAGLEIVGASHQRPIGRVALPGALHTARLALTLEGEARSPSFTLGPRYLHVLAAGRSSRLDLVVDGFTLIRDPVYGGLLQRLDGDSPQWRTFDVAMWQGHRAYLEASDSVVPAPTGDLNRDATQPHDDGWFELHAVVASDEAAPPTFPPDIASLALASDQRIDSPQALAQAYARRLVEARDWFAQADAERAPPAPLLPLVNLLLATGTLDLTEAEAPQLSQWLRTFHETASKLPLPLRAPALADDMSGQDERVLVRGNPRRPGALAPRRPPQFIDQFAANGASRLVPAAEAALTADVRPAAGSGRLALAERILGSGRPLVARVIVNRLWQHHFGRGLVATPDDFGRMGQPPTHPELLDWLAQELVDKGWSLKSLHRQLLTSAVYAQSSQPAAETLAADPTNKLWGRMMVRRLEAEAIRDTMLALADRLDLRVGGPSVLPHLTPFMEGTGRPPSGPLDGDGRRSLYIGVRRNFLSPLFVAFDYPVPFSTMGRRNQSNVPAQALSLLNDPLVWQTAERWSMRSGDETVGTPDAGERRLAAMFEQALARPPRAEEWAAAKEFLQQAAVGDASPAQSWTELAHMLLNVKELIYIP